MKSLQSNNQIATGQYVSEYSSNHWRTATGEVHVLAEMRTEHLFSVFRMLFDRIAPEIGEEPLRGGRGLQASPTWSQEWIAERMVWMMTDILERGDLAEKYQKDFVKMVNSLLRRSNRALQDAKLRQIT